MPPTDAAMPIELNATHDPRRRSWVESANAPGCDFPIQNLPFGLFDDGRGARGGVALGDRIIDLSALRAAGAISGAAADAGCGGLRGGRNVGTQAAARRSPLHAKARGALEAGARLMAGVRRATLRLVRDRVGGEAVRGCRRAEPVR